VFAVPAPEGKVVLGGGGYLKLKNPSGDGGYGGYQPLFPLVASYPSDTGDAWHLVFACLSGNQELWLYAYAVCAS
jgi:hypothetical protein